MQPGEAGPSVGPLPDLRTEASGARRLTIRFVELIPLVVPLAHEYRGSFYRMENRSTIVTRVHTEEGIVGEAYAGDEDATLGAIRASSATRSRPG